MSKEEIEKEIAKLSAKKKLTDDESEELESLQEELSFIIRYNNAFSIPRPTCCEAAQKYPAITFHVDVYGSSEDESPDEGRWKSHLHSGLIDYYYQKYGTSYRKDMPEIKFCSFCGESLSKMKRNEKIKVCKVTDGGYYCDTCNERLSSCLCLPPEAAFEEVKK